MIIGRSALVLIITVVIAVAPLISASLGISRVNGPVYASVAAAPTLQDDNEGEDNESDDNEGSDNEGSDNDGDDLFDNEGDDGSDNDDDLFDSSDNDIDDGNVLSLNSNAALGSDDNDNGFLDGNDNSDDNGNSSNDNGGPAVATASTATPTPTATGAVTACLQPSQQAVLTVPEGRVILRNTAPAAVQVTLARIDLATAPLPAPPGPRLGGQNGLAFNLGVAACGGAALAALPGPADLAVQYTDAAVAAGGVNEANLKAATLQGTTWVPVPSQRNNPALNEVVAQVTAPGTYSVHNGHP